MTFTYTSDLTVNRDYVRFHTGDTVSDQSYLSDEIITSLLAVESSKQQAVIAGLRYIITRLSQPDFRADWLQVSHKAAREGYEKRLNDKYAEFGIAKYDAGTVHTYRGDSATTEEPDYSDGRP